MGTVRTLIIMIIVALLPHPAVAQDEYCPKFYLAVSVDTPPTIDGNLDEDCWKEGERGSSFTELYSATKEAKEQTAFYILYDKENLYFAVECEEPNIDKLLKTQTEHDGDVFNDDSIEIFIAPEDKVVTYYHFVVNALGTRYDAKEFDRGWNCAWEAKAASRKEGWATEVKIPFSSLGVNPQDGNVWRFNIDRSRQAGAESEYSCWSDTGQEDSKGFHSTGKFGYLVFGSFKPFLDKLFLQYDKKKETIGQSLVKHPEQTGPFQEEIKTLFSSLDSIRKLIREKKVFTGKEIAPVYLKLKKTLKRLEEIEQEISFSVLMGEGSGD